MENLNGFEASEGFISDITDKLLAQIEEWQKRPLAGCRTDTRTRQIRQGDVSKAIKANYPSPHD